MSADFRTVFTKDEMLQAFAAVAVTSDTEARAMIDEVYAAPEDSVLIAGDILNVLSLLSPSAAQRVQDLLNESSEQARVRIEQFLVRRPELRRAQGND